MKKKSKLPVSLSSFMFLNARDQEYKMRSFSSYGPINTKLHYYAPREELVNRVHIKLIGANPEEGGHYITVCGPRQTGKTWAMQQILFRLQNDNKFDVLMIPLEHLKMEDDIGNILNSIGKRIAEGLNVKISRTDTPEEFERIFRNGVLTKPLVLILDEFDALAEDAVSTLAGIFRNIYNIRQYQLNETSGEKDYLLHGLALLGVRSVLGIENAKGSPFNVQRSMHIPNLEFTEVAGMFKWYEKESGQQIKQEVIERVFYETAGQPGLTCWFAELLTDGFEEIQVDKNKLVDMNYFEESYAAAVSILPNNNILNIISKAKKKPYMKTVLE
ncbi:AAA-like domain-containing protein, partial [Desulfobacterales bacterium HSG16]|nr:AAA-like domain-containing protein [Desulfobacterales bacterium HSG16]